MRSTGVTRVAEAVQAHFQRVVDRVSPDDGWTATRQCDADAAAPVLPVCKRPAKA